MTDTAPTPPEPARPVFALPGLHSAANRAALTEQHLAEEAGMRLLAVTPPDLMVLVGDEVERRKALFERVRTDTRYAAVVWPLRAALLSVYDDLVAGRLV